MAGEYPRCWRDDSSMEKLEGILASGITSFLDLTDPRDGLKDYHPLLRSQRYRQMTITDMGIPTVEGMREILGYLHQELEQGQSVYVHCWGGIGRTGTVVGCYLVEQGRSGEQALEEIAGHWATVEKRVRFPTSPQTFEQLQFVRQWKKALSQGLLP